MPPSRPRMSSAELQEHLAPLNIDREKYPILSVWFRGYYRDSMGRPGVNDRSIFDDAAALVSPNAFLMCNGNVDPTAARGAVTGRASLKPGFWPMWKLDLHRGKYLALCQRAAECVVFRDNTEGFKAGSVHAKYGTCLGGGFWRGWFGINGHGATATYTSSEGCLTIPRPQWEGYIALTEAEARRHWGAKWRSGVIPSVLIDLAA
jgi:hypothetical protein